VTSTSFSNGDLLVASDATLYDGDSFIRVFEASGGNTWFCSEGCLRTNIPGDANSVTNGIVYDSEGSMTPAEVLNSEELLASRLDLTVGTFLFGLISEVNDRLEDENQETTIFVPNDSFFLDYDLIKLLDCLQDPESRDFLSQIIRFHTVDGLLPTFLWNNDEITLLGGTTDRLYFSGGEVNGADLGM
jgi:hypothetical protein